MVTIPGMGWQGDQLQPVGSQLYERASPSTTTRKGFTQRLAPRMRHFSNSRGIRGRVGRLLILISGEMIWLRNIEGSLWC